MRCIYVDRMDDGRIGVRICAGLGQPKTKHFTDRDEAIKFAESKMGQKGMVLDTTLMTAEQLAAHKDREARTKAIWEAAEKKT